MANRIVAGRAFIVLEAMDKTGKVLNATYRRFVGFATSIQSLGQRILTRALAAATPQALSVRAFQNFDDIMRKVEARSNGTAQEMRTLRLQARELGRTTAFTATQIGNLMDILAQRGFTRTQMADMTPGILNLARAAGSGDLAQDALNAADLVTNALRGYQMEASESTRIADMFTAAANESNFDLQDLIISMANAASITKLYNTSLEETLALLSVMRDVGIDPSVAGTGLRNIFLKASDKKGSEEFNAIMHKMTGKIIQFRDEVGNLKEPADILFSMFDAMKGLGTAEVGDAISELFGLRAIIPAGATLPQRERFEHLLKVITEAGGLAKRQAEDMDKGIGGAFRRMRGAIESLGITIGEALEKPVQAATMYLRQLNIRLEEWVKNNQRLIVQVAIVTTLALLFGTALVAIGVVLKVLSVGILLVSGALIAFKFIILTVTTLVGLLVGAFTLLWTVGVALAGAVVTIIGALAAIIPILISVVGWVAFFAAAVVSLFVQAFVVAIPAILMGFIRWFGRLFPALIPVINKLYRMFMLFLFGAGRMGMMQDTPGQLNNVKQKIVEVEAKSGAVAKSVERQWTQSATHIGSLFSRIGDILEISMGSITDMIMSGHWESAFRLLGTTIKLMFLEIKNSILTIFEDVVDYIMGAMIPVITRISRLLAFSNSVTGMKGWSSKDHISFARSLSQSDPSKPFNQRARAEAREARSSELWAQKLYLLFQTQFFKVNPGFNIIDTANALIDRTLHSIGMPRASEELAVAGLPTVSGTKSDIPDAVEMGTLAAYKAFMKNQDTDPIVNQLVQANQNLDDIEQNTRDIPKVKGK